MEKNGLAGSVSLLVLSLLRDGDKYGYEMISQLALRSEQVFELKEGTLYPVLHQLEREGSQFLIATHSPILMAYPGAEVLELREEGICSVDYRQTEHYQLTRRFLEAPERMLKYLFENE